MTDPIRWGILGTGSIAKQFARGLTAVADANLLAVGSRAAETAATFADEFDVPHRHASYEELVTDADVDAIYISTPHPFHKDNSILCLKAGKAVLCEKPFAMNAAEARAVIDVARAEDVFLMEAMWTRYIPAVIRARELVARGAIGKVRMVQADFGFRADINHEGRLFSPALGGGALLDVGVYVVSFAAMVLGAKPINVESVTTLGETDVDEQSSIVMRYPGGEQATLSCAVRTNTPVEATIIGTEGRIRVHSPFFKAEKLTVLSGGEEQEIEMPMNGNGYNYEAIELGECLRAGRKESPVMPLEETIAIMEILDGIRADWGLKYPME
ncbi:MAG: Gfo/Idh/MocA family oxidoreductase [Candidatus Latescibacterota bacterium]|nr:Gfo/Idh/MocA family oxidoreductase [Candidatus Latescibacterota bacterium]